jgi:D-alanine-D-alanine ligase
MSLPLDIHNQKKIQKKMRLAYLYTESELTPWKENVNEATLNFLIANTPANIEADIVHFDGFNDEVLDTLRNYDLIFNLCYGYEDAGQVEVAGWLEHNNLAHTASFFESMIKAQDKSLLPDICNTLRIRTPEVFSSFHQLDDNILYLSKPRKGSCHRNITIQKGAWMKENLTIEGADLIIQPYIPGREFSVAVIPSDKGQYYMALPPLEIVPENDSLIYVAGQSFGKTYRNFNPVLSDYQEDQLMLQAEALHKVIGLKGMSRTDFRMSEDGTIFVLDVNAMPNMDPERSLMPALCLHHGVEISNLIQRVIFNTLFIKEKSIGYKVQKNQVTGFINLPTFAEL